MKMKNTTAAVNVLAGRGRLAGMIAAALICGTCCGAEPTLHWTGAVSTLWDFATQNWADSSDVPCVYRDGESVLVDTSKFTGNLYNMTATSTFNPSEIEFHVEKNKTITHTTASGAAVLFGASVTKVRKTGEGTYFFDNWSNMRNFAGFKGASTVEVENGVMRMTGPNTVYTMGPDNGAPTQWNVWDGATLQMSSRNMSGNPGLGSSVKLFVKKGGTLKFGPDPQNASYQCGGLFNEVKFEGGSHIVWGDAYDLNGGQLCVWKRLSVSGNEAVTIGTAGDANHTVFLGRGGSGTLPAPQVCARQDGGYCVIDVDDVAEGVDLDIAARICRQSGYETNMVGFVKTGPGTLRFSATGDAVQFGINGDIDIIFCDNLLF